MSHLVKGGEEEIVRTNSFDHHQRGEESEWITRPFSTERRGFPQKDELAKGGGQSDKT